MRVETTLVASDRLFGDLPVNAKLAGALDAMGYTEPTPIQAAAIPTLRQGKDVVGLARTGSGKTAGFGIPMVESVQSTKRQVQALVLVPTRELASQVTLALQQLGAGSGVRVVAVYGGVGMSQQIQALRGNAHVVIGTPGRVLDHLNRGTMDLRHTKMVVLDEADRMLDVGFAPAIEAILSRIPGPRQTALFSATFPKEVETLAARHTRDAERIAVDMPGAALETLEERFQRVPSTNEKTESLEAILKGDDCKLALVFRRTTHRADKLAHDLERRGYRVATLHGRRSQSQRERALGALRAGQVQALVATDIAARGLDITGLTHVVNFDLPDTAENYTHRIGRTARMGKDGIAVTLVAPEDEEALLAIRRKLPQSAGRPALPQLPAGTRPAPRGQTPAPRRQQRPHSQPQGRASIVQPAARTPRGVPTQAQGPRSPQRETHQPRPVERVAVPAQRDTQAGVPATPPDSGWYPFRSSRSPRP